MPTHFVYKEPDKTTLCQGDVLKKTEHLVTHLKQYHPHYANHSDYKYFMVLTQSCDLVRRDGRPCASPYITLAAVRPLDTVLRREAAKSQTPWQRETKVLSAKAKGKLQMFLESLLDNNKEGFFYLHTDVSVDIQQACCAFLRLTIALKADNYDMCLDAKIAELHEPFQAKLGYLSGQLYSRVGTSEWNAHNPDEKVAVHAAKVLKKTFITYDDKQIDEGIADLKKDGSIEALTSEQIRMHIDKKKVVPRKQKFKERAVEVLCEPGNRLINQIRDQVNRGLRTDPSFISGIDELLKEARISDESLVELRDSLISKFMKQLGEHCCDEKMQEKKKIIEKMLTDLMRDSQIGTIMQ